MARLYALTARGPVPVAAPPKARECEDTHALFSSLPEGVYSGLRTYQGHFLRLDDHLARTEQSMQLSGWSRALDRKALRRALDALAREDPENKRVRFDVLEAPHAGFDVYIGIGRLVPVPEAVLRLGARVAVARGLRRTSPLIKTTNFVTARRQFVERDATAYEHVMIDEDERLLECVSSNIYGVRNGTIYTAATQVLEGITRRIVLELAAAHGIPVRLEPVALAEIDTLDEAFLTSSTREVVPVTRVENVVVGSGKPGPISNQLLAAYRRYAAEHARPA
ncbi:MAG TPA: aminotransferase class IV [Polyangiaceae bacterium]|nr:aminotransferase class IV [Polyangiaceae bacterium]